MDNARIAERLEAFAALLDLAEANPYQPRAYRRAAETVRAAPVPVAALVRSGRVRRLRGVGPGIEGRLRELVEPGQIAALVELARAVVCAAEDAEPARARFAELPQVGALLEREPRRAIGVTVEGVPIELVVAK